MVKGQKKEKKKKKIDFSLEEKFAQSLQNRDGFRQYKQ
jgi:hypothetical protein